MDLNKIKEALGQEPSFRIKQIKKAIFQDLLEDWLQITTLPALLRNELNKKIPLLIEGKVFISKEKETIKALIKLEDNLEVETVLMQHEDGRNTVCVSSQIGCPLKCSFCATGKLGFKRNLTSSEIILQVLFFSRYLKPENQRVSNIVFMGMGEPFLNYDNVLEAIKIFNDKDGFNIGARKISISTAGIIEGIKKLAQERLQINLAISLHAPEDSLRTKIMPVNKKYSIREVLDAVDSYILKTNRRVMFEYIMIKDVNDSDENAEKLAELMKKPLYLINLISYNPTEVFRASDLERINSFKNILEQNKVAVTQRYRFGQDIEGACGQLVYKNSEK